MIEVSAICLFNDAEQVLTVRKQGTHGWMLPGGKPETGETPLECILREVDEELAVRLDARQIAALGTFDSTAVNEGTPLRAHVFISSQAIGPQPGAEIAELRWVDPADPGEGQAPLNTQHIFPLLSDQLARHRAR